MAKWPVQEFRATLSVGPRTWLITKFEQVGANPASSIFIDHPTVKNIHCLIYSNGDEVIIQNLGPDRTILINSHKMEPFSKVLLTTKTVLKIGAVYAIVSFKKPSKKQVIRMNEEGISTDIDEDFRKGLRYKLLKNRSLLAIEDGAKRDRRNSGKSPNPIPE